MKTNTFVLGAAHSHALEMAMNRDGNGEWSNQLVDKMSQRDNLGQVFRLLSNPDQFFANRVLKDIRSHYSLEELNTACYECCTADIERIFYRAFERVRSMDPIKWHDHEPHLSNYHNGEFEKYVSKLIKENGMWGYVELTSLVAEFALTKSIHASLNKLVASKIMDWKRIVEDYLDSEYRGSRTVTRLRLLLGTDFDQAVNVAQVTFSADVNEYGASILETIHRWSRGRI